MIIKLNTSVNCTPRIVNKRNFKKADWVSYRNYILEKQYRCTMPANPQEAYSLFLDIINGAADARIPYINFNQNPSSQFKPRPYWSPMLSKARRLALTNFRKNPTPDNLRKLQEKTREAQRLTRNARMVRGFRKFCSSRDEVRSK